jgi:hypothetical protein
MRRLFAIDFLCLEMLRVGALRALAVTRVGSVGPKRARDKRGDSIGRNI